MFVVGLTGGIGSGKTVVSDYFADLGVPIIDTDIIARLVVEPGHSALDALVAAFGSDILTDDGRLNRSALRTLAFSNKENKQTLDNITHPAIRLETLKQIHNVTYPYCLVVVPLLTSASPFSEVMQRVLVVTADRETKVERVKKRSNLARDEIERIMATQLDDRERLSFADDVISNNGSIADAQHEVQKLHELYLELSAAA